MNIKLRNKTTNEIISSFNSDNIKITNDGTKFSYKFEIEIDKTQYDLLETLNYSVLWYQDPVITGGGVSNEMINKMGLKTRKYYLSIQLHRLTDNEINDFYGQHLGYNSVDLSLKLIDIEDECFKTENMDIYIDGKLVDVRESICQEEITYTEKK